MTRPEAIKQLKEHTQYCIGGKDLIALNIAINSLEIDEKYQLEFESMEEYEDDKKRICNICNGSQDILSQRESPAK